MIADSPGPHDRPDSMISIGKKRWPHAALLILILGCVLRLAYAFPVHKYAADADCLNSGLRAFRVLEGHLPVFYTTVRIGAFECYEHAAAFAIFGVSRTSLALAPLLAGCLVLLIGFFFLRNALGEVTGSLALLFLALPSSSYVFWTYMPNCYPETMLFCFATLWLADLIGRRGAGQGLEFALGLAGGLGWWNSPQTLVTLVPSLVWLIWLRRDLLRQRRFLVLLPTGFLLGALPWIAYNIRHPLASFHEDLAAGAAKGMSAVMSNARFLMSYSVPELIASLDPARTGVPPVRVQRLLWAPVVAVHAAAFLFAATLLVAWVIRCLRNKRECRPPSWFLFILVAATVLALNIFSLAGTQRGLTVRYILPAYYSVIVFLALFIRWIGRRLPAAAWILAAVIIVFNFSGYALWWTPQRIQWREGLEVDRSLMTFLRKNQIQAVCGNYWFSYPVNFLSQEAILGIPDHLEADHYGYAQRLGSQPLRWALIAKTDHQLRVWVGRTQLTGTFAHPSPEFFLFVPDLALCREEPGSFLTRILTALYKRPEKVA